MKIPRLLLCLVVGIYSIASARAVDKPNILLIVADDLGWQDVGWHGGPFKTPQMDALVKGGAELDQHYVQPVCTPTRTALMSGRYPGRFGPQALVPSLLRAMPIGTVTMASALKSVGYETYISGKWHLGARMEWGPNSFGFDHSYGSLTGAVDPWTHQYRAGPYQDTWHRDCKPAQENGNATELVAAEALKWIRQKKSPWFLYVPFHAVHIPVDAPDEFKRLYDGVKFDPDPARHDSRLRLGAFVSQLDAKIGQLVAALDETGQRNNTLIIFTSDNGGLRGGGNPYVGQTGPSPANSVNTPLRGQKGELFEGGIRVCAFANWPGVLSPRKVVAPMHAVDWLPTLSALAGYKPAEELNWDGRDMWPAITGADPTPAPRTIYWAYTKESALRDGDWKLIVKKGGKSLLFNLGVDPYEEKDLAATEPARLAKLQSMLAEAQAGDRKEIPADLANFREKE